jgi:hypothetical protein
VVFSLQIDISLSSSYVVNIYPSDNLENKTGKPNENEKVETI